jgi:hypothetical protein
MLTVYYRAQTDTQEAAKAKAPCVFTFKGSLDPSGTAET